MSPNVYNLKNVFIGHNYVYFSLNIIGLMPTFSGVAVSVAALDHSGLESLHGHACLCKSR